MQGAVLYGPRDVRFEERPAPTIVKPTDAVIRLSATCVCGSDLWPLKKAFDANLSAHALTLRRTIGRRILISRFDDESGRCSGFEV